MAILSIQSHVVYGYAGNSSAVFPLQRLGHEVWAVNTVEFSNHTGYGSWRGQALGADLVDDLMAGLAERGVLAECRAVLSGYLGRAATAGAIKRAVETVRAASPQSIYCCDPVMGDLGRGLYVDADILEMFRNELVPRATIVTPNQFELCLLTNTEPTASPFAAEKAPVLRALEMLHARGPRVVLLTSFGQGAPSFGKISMLASAGGRVWRVSTPELPFAHPLAGSGDLTAAVFLAHYLETGDARLSLEHTVDSVYGILYAMYLSGRRELCTITNQDELLHPTHRFSAELF